MNESANIKPQEVFDCFLLNYGSDDIRRFFGEREVTDAQIASMKDHARRRKQFREWQAKVDRRQGRLAARAEKRAIRMAGLEK